MTDIDCKIWGGQAKRATSSRSSSPASDDGHNHDPGGSSGSNKQVLKKGTFDDKACELCNKKTSDTGYVPGKPITKLQQTLIDMGFLKQDKPDGDFGEKTEQAMKDFQTAALKKDRLCKNCTDLTKAPSITYTGTSDGIYGEHSDTEMTLWTNKNWIKPVKSFKKGDSGPELQNFQTTLQDIGVYIDRAVDGWFWNKMQDALNQFQEAAEKGKFIINGVLTDIEKLTGHHKGDLCPKTQDHLKMVKDKGGKVPSQKATKTSENGIQFIMKNEGFRDKPYNDSAGYATIGYGTLLHKSAVNEDDNKKYANGITKEDAKKLLEDAVVDFENALNKAVKISLNQNQFDALMDWTYNFGPARLNEKNCTWLRELNTGNYDQVPDHLLSWNKALQDGKLVELPGLTKRRKDEGDLFKQQN
jgi:GH24 family phage-related lysozyme (muramidase)/peptidoglycan hydrolase-like protein with peptidoglycan-binding domain